jgi:hypothetical protein
MKIFGILALFCCAIAQADTTSENLKKEILTLTPIGSSAANIPKIIQDKQLIFVTKESGCLGPEYFYHAKTEEDINRAYWITWMILKDDKIESVHVFKAK